MVQMGRGRVHTNFRIVGGSGMEGRKGMGLGRSTKETSMME